MRLFPFLFNFARTTRALLSYDLLLHAFGLGGAVGRTSSWPAAGRTSFYGPRSKAAVREEGKGRGEETEAVGVTGRIGRRRRGGRDGHQDTGMMS